jgi:hypothetical protein
MKVIFNWTKFLFINFLPIIVFGQDASGNSINLKSGTIQPPQNIRALIKDQSALSPAKFNDHYYVVIQFKQVPSAQQKVKLHDLNIRLIDYLPQNAYTAAIPVSLSFTCLKKLSANSIFYLEREQKLSSSVIARYNKNVGKHHITFIDVNVQTYEAFSPSKLEEDISNLQSIILSHQPVYRTLTVRAPIHNLYELAALPFVQWIELIAPPDAVESN